MLHGGRPLAYSSSMAPGRGKSRGLSWRAQRQILAIAAYAFLSTQAVTAEDTCQGPVVRARCHAAAAGAFGSASVTHGFAWPQVKLGVSNGTSPVKTLYGVLAGFGGIPSLQESSPLQLAVADPIQACQDIKPVAGGLAVYETAAAKAKGIVMPTYSY